MSHLYQPTDSEAKDQPPVQTEQAASEFAFKRFVFGCLVVILVPFLFCSGLILTFQRTRTVERGFKFTDHSSGDFTFDAWGNGEWAYKKDGLVSVSEHLAPFTLLIAIRSKSIDIASIEMLSVKATLKNGQRIDLLPFLKNKKGSLVERGRGAILDEYKVLHFEKALLSNDDIQVELEFETESAGKKKSHRRQLTIPGYEKQQHSLYFWDVMSSV